MIEYTDEIHVNHNYSFRVLESGKTGYCDTKQELQIIADKNGDISYQKLGDTCHLMQVTDDMLE